MTWDIAIYPRLFDVELICLCGENVGKILKSKMANKLIFQLLAIFLVPRAGIEPAWK